MMEESENPMKMMMVRSSIVRTVVLALGVAALGALPAIAQDTPTGPPPQGPRGGGMEHQVEFLTKKLNLTPDQVTQVKAIDDSTRQQMMALRNDTSTTSDEKRPKMMAIRQASDAKIRALLTPDQQTKYDAMQAEMREHRRDGSGGPPPPPPPSTPQP
jgi:periplasmic protein CpxP/Spy